MRRFSKFSAPLLLTAAASLTFFPVIAAAQEATRAPTAEPIGTLMMFTLGSVLLIAVFLLVSFLRKRSNRDAMRRLNDE
jgi:ABC-type transport system involved in multi-copper enzyme maturation permease subunit